MKTKKINKLYLLYFELSTVPFPVQDVLIDGVKRIAEVETVPVTDRTVFYAGTSVEPAQRFVRHRSESRDGSSRKCLIWRLIEQHGGTVKMHVRTEPATSNFGEIDLVELVIAQGHPCVNEKAGDMIKELSVAEKEEFMERDRINSSNHTDKNKKSVEERREKIKRLLQR